tara:strand:- start:2319 stop:2555 length:237 start_codon:yes stop_codon:yes gene_type:complete
VAYVVLIAEGDASQALHATWHAKSERLRTHTRSPGALVLYDTNLAREFVRDVKNRVDGGRLVVFRCDEPHEIVGEESS